MRLAVIAAFVGLLSCDAFAQTADEWNRDLSEMRRKQPAEYSSLVRVLTAVTEMRLARLGYDPGPFDGTLDERTTEAIRRYEAARSLPLTGDPTSFATMRRLEADDERLDATPVFLPEFVFSDSMWEDGWASAAGTWQLVADTNAYPEQTTHLDCDRAAGRCLEATATVSAGSSGRLLALDVTHYDIERWDAHEIVTKPYESLAGCTRNVLRVNRRQKSVSATRSTISTENLCKHVELRDLHAQLVDGMELWKQRLAEHNAAIKELLKIAPGVTTALERR